MLVLVVDVFVFLVWGIKIGDLKLLFWWYNIFCKDSKVMVIICNLVNWLCKLCDVIDKMYKFFYKFLLGK